MNIREALVRTAGRLSDGALLDAHLEAEVLLRHLLGMQRARFFAALEEPLGPSHQECLHRLVERRLHGEPVAYIVGHREFYGLDLLVDSRVLIPRQETELLVDKALEFCSARLGCDHLRIADVGTGSGAIAIALARRLPQATVFATDRCRDALAVADANRRKHGVADRVNLRQGDLLEALDGPVDALVSNPPYLRTEDIARLAPEIRWEPRWALDGGPDGLDIISRLLRQAPAYLRPNGCVLVEISPEQLHCVCHLARAALPVGVVSFHRDMLGLPRAVSVELP